MRSFLTVIGLVVVLPVFCHVEGQTNASLPDPTSLSEAGSNDWAPQLVQQGSSRFSVGGFVGYLDGVSFQAFVTANDFAQGLPFRARLRIARTAVEPGSAPDARRVFINDATNGTPKEAGSTWDFGLDGLFPMGERTHFYGGVRYTKFKANFKYVGGNEDFDVTSNHWGVSAGLEAEYPMTRKVSLILTGGAEYFFGSRLTGHDTSYSPDGDDVNPRKDYTYDDADDAVDQPVLRPVALVGFSYRLGR